MKYNFVTRKESISKKIKLCGELCLLAFVICALSLMVYLAKSPGEPSVSYEDEELISVFKESDMYDLFGFDEIEETGEGVWEISSKKGLAQLENE